MTSAVISLQGIAKCFGSLEVIRHLDLDVLEGERHALIGPNGAGKSTLVGMISGLIPLSAGAIFLNGRRIDGLAPERINRLGLGRSFQITRIFPRLSAQENLRIGVMARHGIRYSLFRPATAYSAVAREVEALLAKVRLDGRAGVVAGELSYSEQRALELGMALASEPKVLLLDEPTAGMSRDEADHVVDLIRTIAIGRTVLIVEHDMDVVFSLCDRVTVLAYGELIASGPAAEIRRNARVQEAYLGTEHVA
ncbi:MAG: ATP-binding cassette domain-containing protein [Rhodospirillales bacterium]|nr:ATP-binding cassette domain-containing protein [Rhodospirillales bacterium]